MKTFTKITSLALAGVMLMSVASCSLLGGKFGPLKLINYARGEGYEPVDSAHAFRELKDKDFKNGVCISLLDKDIKSVLDTEDLTVIPVLKNYYSRDITEAALFMKVKKTDEKTTAIYAFSMVFEDEDDAEDYFDEVHDGIQPNPGVPANNDDGTDDGINYSVMNIEDGDHRAAVGVYRDGKTVLLLIGYGNKDKKIIKNIDAICEAFGVHSVTDT
ncbi:hypothetical protein SAMN02910456_02139 [Ruminococcaceae bacterium YRB3002]|nr:hypothetical protein SAMN02910456_02139 [Ruminococcaceae bacterium YRB3002]